MTIYTGTFDVQRGDVVVQDSTTGLVCFTSIFVEGSQSLGCSIEYLCTRTEYNGQLNITRSLGSQNVTKCIDGIYTSDYNISFYDIEHDGVINYQPAYQLIQRSIDGLSPLIMLSSPSLSPSPTPSSSSSSSSPSSSPSSSSSSSPPPPPSSSSSSSSSPTTSQTGTTMFQTPSESPTTGRQKGICSNHL